MAEGYASAMQHAPVHAGHRRPTRRPRSARPRKAPCKHCGNEVTPAPGSPMHQQQVSPGMAAMQQQGMHDNDGDEAMAPEEY